jgi:hypothetical protein
MAAVTFCTNALLRKKTHTCNFTNIAMLFTAVIVNCSGETSPTFGHPNAHFSAFIDRMSGWLR